MNATYKIKISENQKSVTGEIVVEGDNSDEVYSESVELYNKVSKFCKLKTIQKVEN